MKIGILGSGLMGGKIGTILARRGHHVTFSYARQASKLERLAREAGPTAHAGTPAEAAASADAVLLAVNWGQIDEVLEQAGDLSGRVVMNCSLPLDPTNSSLLVAHRNSGAEVLARNIPQARWVSIFNTIPSEVLFDVAQGALAKERPSVLMCGSDPAAKRIASTVAEEIGFTPIDAGEMSVARYTEPMALLVGELAYRQLPSPALWYRFATV